MPAPHPRMHGITHVAGGPDPVPGLLPPTGDTLDKKILAVAPAGFWKLNESSGHVAADSSGNNQDLSTTSPELDPLWGQPAGPPGEQAASFEPGDHLDGSNSRVHRAWPIITGSFTAGIWVNRTSSNSAYVMGQGIGTAAGWYLRIGALHPGVYYPDAVMAHSTGSSGEQIGALNPLPPGTWGFLAMAYDHAAGQFKLYINGLLDATSPTFTFVPAGGGTGQHDVFVGHILPDDVSSADVIGSYAFLVNRALSGAEILDINAASVTAGTAPGSVLTTDTDGNPVWVLPPAVNVVDGAGYSSILTGSNLTSTDNGDGTVTLDATAAGGDPAADAQVWMPLFDADGQVVLDSTGGLIPSLIPI